MVMFISYFAFQDQYRYYVSKNSLYIIPILEVERTVLYFCFVREFRLLSLLAQLKIWKNCWLHYQILNFCVVSKRFFNSWLVKIMVTTFLQKHLSWKPIVIFTFQNKKLQTKVKKKKKIIRFLIYISGYSRTPQIRTVQEPELQNLFGSVKKFRSLNFVSDLDQKFGFEREFGFLKSKFEEPGGKSQFFSVRIFESLDLRGSDLRGSTVIEYNSSFKLSFKVQGYPMDKYLIFSQMKLQRRIFKQSFEAL
eukprot:TRINITY_DN6611_c0_g4_i1.p1 TRINITY_DN6611_c0_g4~~TRINITY_DN6611_c0_g4_i1.p1  ORF type:complete len:250 (+),score=1.00 TRINITY_DN6611_c0_g4_i1:428-1177(+)